MSSHMYEKIETALIHGGIEGDTRTGAVSVPIYQASTYQQDGLGKDRGYEYARSNNPTREALEALIAELEHGVAGFAFASGLAAITAVLSLFNSGDKLLISKNVYGGTYRVLDQVFTRFGIGYHIVDTADLEVFADAFTDDIKAVLIETPANPLLTVTDIAAVSKIAKAHNALLIVDNTFLTPYLQKPIDLGADIVVHSATKYLGGHSDLIAGLAVVNSDELAKRLKFLQNATGGILQPFDSFLLQRSIKTLSVRMERHVENAERIANHLVSHPAVKAVYYPGLKASSDYAIQHKQAKNGGAMITFELNDEYDFRTFFEEIKLIKLAESLGGVESLACHPYSMTHASIPKDIRESIGITEQLIRLSIGLEHFDDIIADINQAIERSRR